MSGGARRVWLVARREWNQRVRTLAFRISTLISILIVVVLIMVPEMYGGGAKPTRTVGLVGQSSSQLPALLRASGDQLGLSVKTRTFADEAAGRAALRSGDVSVLLVDQRELVWKAEVDDQLQAIVTSAVRRLEQQQAIGELGLTPAEAQRLLQPPDLPSTSLEPATKERRRGRIWAAIGVVLLFMAIAFYCSFVLVGVVEEKSSRVVEVLLSRLRPTELLAGKVLGIGLVGLAQFALVGGVGPGRTGALGQHTGSRRRRRARSGGSCSGSSSVTRSTRSCTRRPARWSRARRRPRACSSRSPAVLFVGVHPRVRGDASRRTARRRSWDRSSPHGSDGDDRPHRARGRPLVADRPVGRADGGHGLRHGAGGRADLRRRGAPVRRPGAVEGGMAGRPGALTGGQPSGCRSVRCVRGVRTSDFRATTSTRARDNSSYAAAV